MKHLTIVTVGVSLSLPLAVAQETPEVKPLNVYLYAKSVGEPLQKSEKLARENELKSRRKELEKARKTLYDELKANYGKDQDDWPEEQREEYRLAREAESMAQFELDYLRSGAAALGKQKDLDDSLQDILEAIRGKGPSPEHEWVSLVEDVEQAHLIVELSDRASFRFGDEKYLALTISPADALRSSQLEDVEPKENRLLRVRHAFREKEPYWIVECANIGNMWRNAAAVMASTLNEFIKDNRAVLRGNIIQ